MSLCAVEERAIPPVDNHYFSCEVRRMPALFPRHCRLAHNPPSPSCIRIATVPWDAILASNDRHGCLNGLLEAGIGKDSRLRALHIIDQDIIAAHIDLGIIHFIGIVPDQVAVILRIKSATLLYFKKLS